MANITYTFLDMQNKLSSLLGDSGTDAGNQFPLADRKKELNLAEVAFALDSEQPIENTSDTISGMEITLPSDWLETLYFFVNDEYISGDREIGLADKGRLKNYSGDDPYYYTWRFSDVWKLKLLGNSSNINGLTYDIYYVKKPVTELVDDTDTSIHDLEFREAIPYKAAYELLLQIGKTNFTAAYKAIYDEKVMKARKKVNKKTLNYSRPNPDLNWFPASVTDRAGG